MRKAAFTVIAILAALTWQGCNTSGCTENMSSLPLAGFYAYDSKQPVTLDSLAIHGIGAPGDSALLAMGEDASLIYLPLRSDMAMTQYCIAYGWIPFNEPAFNDTITMVYTSTPYFASEECGAAYRYRLHQIDYTHHLLDSVGVSDSLITNIDRERLQLYFKVSTSLPANSTRP